VRSCTGEHNFSASAGLAMVNDPQIIVHFSCQHCLTVYQARQERRGLDDCSGEFYCGRCGSPVHDWTGLYDFSEWHPIANSVPSAKRLW
jgi:hypothetical protein